MNKINFENLPSTNTPINAENLNLIQSNVETAINYVDSTINNKFVYSTDEIVIGEWFGKPLYRKCFKIVQELTTGTVNVAHNISDVDIMSVNTGKSFMHNLSGNRTSYNFPINQYRESTNFDEVGIFADRNNISFLVKTNWPSNVWNIYVTLEYTKTTD